MKKTKFERATVPPLHEHWNSPPSKEYGDVTDDAVFLAVGRALSTWEEIEVALANMFALFVESYSDAAKRAFGAISSSSGRREALENAAEMFASMQGDDFPKKTSTRSFPTLRRRPEEGTKLPTASSRRLN